MVVDTTDMWVGLPAPHGLTGENATFVEFVSIPDDKQQKALLERLVARSTDPDGLDRRALLDLDDHGWGLPESDA
jgi:hypothetical protein